MGAQQIDPKQLLPKWVTDRVPLYTEDVAQFTNHSVEEIRALRKAGVIRAMLNRRPYRFDPLHIYDVFFGSNNLTPLPLQGSERRSLKTENGNPHSHKPVKKEDLWQE